MPSLRPAPPARLLLCALLLPCAALSAVGQPSASAQVLAPEENEALTIEQIDAIERAAYLKEKGIGLAQAGRFADVVQVSREVVDVLGSAFGDEHERVVSPLNDLGGLLYRIGEPREARAHLRRAHALAKRAASKAQVARAAHFLGLIARDHDEDLAEAERRFREAYAIRAENPGDPEDPSAIGRIASDLGELLRQTERPGEAIPLFEQAAKTWRAVRGEADPVLVRELYRLGATLIVAGRAAEARAPLAEALPAMKELYGEASIPVLAVRIELGLAELGGGDADAAAAHLEAATALGDQLPEDHPLRVRAQSGLALVRNQQGDAGAAIEASAAALAQLDPDDPERGTMLYSHASLLLQWFRVEEAHATFEEALGYGERHGELAVMVAALENLGTLEQTRVPERAIARYRRARSILEREPEPYAPRILDLLRAEARLHGGLADYVEARGLLDRALTSAAGLTPPDPREVAEVKEELGLLLRRLGDVDGALRAYDEARALHLAGEAPPGPVTLANLLSNRSVALQDAEELEAALAAVGEGLSLLEEASLLDTPLAASLYANRGSLLGELRRDDEALADIRRAQALAAIWRPEDSPLRLVLLQDEATLLLRDPTRVEEARALLEEAHRALSVRLGPSHPSAIWALHSLASVDTHPGGDRERARRRFCELLTRQGEQILRQLASVAPRRRLAVARRTRWFLDHWIELTRTGDDPGYREVLRLKGIVGRWSLLEAQTARRSEAGRAALEAARAAEEELGAIRALPARTEGERRRRDRALAGARETVDRHAREALAHSLTLATVRRQLAVEPGEVATRLRPGEALVDTIHAGERYWAFVLRAGRAPVRVELGGASEVDAAIERFLASVRGAADPADASFRRDGAALVAKLWTPIADAVGGADTVFLVPDGRLAAAPFGLLPSGEGAGVLLDRMTFVHLGSALELIPWSDAAPRAGHGALVVGDVDFDAAEPDSVDRAAPRPEPTAGSSSAPTRLEPIRVGRPTFRPLRASRREAAFAAESLGGPDAVTALFGAAATEAAVREAAPGRRVLHLATHAFTRPAPRRPLRASPHEELVPARAVIHTREDVLSRSGLALAGSNRGAARGGGDGILTALEAAALDLRGADLVVLSACDTAGGETERGEGVLGLTLGFRAAGAEQVLASLWPVDDDATAAFMGALYRTLSGGPRPDGERLGGVEGALRTAQRAHRAAETLVPDRRAGLRLGRPVWRPARAAPRAWGAFVVYGTAPRPAPAGEDR